MSAGEFSRLGERIRRAYEFAAAADRAMIAETAEFGMLIAKAQAELVSAGLMIGAPINEAPAKAARESVERTLRFRENGLKGAKKGARGEIAAEAGMDETAGEMAL